MLKTKAEPQIGFTLIELLIVVVILTTLAAGIMPLFFSKTDESKVVTAKTTVRNIQKKIEAQSLINGQWPTDIDNAWFVNRQHPRSPYYPNFQGPSANAVNEPAYSHPRVKTPEEEGHPPFWYNFGNGSFRIRVPEQRTEQQTIELYNAVNDSKIVGLYDRSDTL